MIRYGQVVTTDTYVDWEKVNSETFVVKQVRADSQEDILKELIKLQKRVKEGKIHSIGVQSIQKDGNLKYVKLSYKTI